MSEFGAHKCPKCYTGEPHEHSLPYVPERPGPLCEAALARRLEILEGRLDALAFENRQWREKLPDLDDLRALRDEARMPDVVIPIHDRLIQAGSYDTLTWRNFAAYTLRWIVLGGDDAGALRVCGFFIGVNNMFTCAPTADGSPIREFCQVACRSKWEILPGVDITINVRNIGGISSRVWGCVAGRSILAPPAPDR